ncbi:MAG TPA: hypothetical protein VFP47_01755, partial [Pyrinomonadaceae bacterium]|nr:hypothetical protein [Pyrinomonadaceae bacterium]
MKGSSRICLLAVASTVMVFVLGLNQLQSAHPAVVNFDLVITNGRIVDGTGNPWFRADIGIKEGRIVRIGKIDPALGSKS